MATDVSEKTRAVRLDLPERAHRLLRRIAADCDVSMAAYTRDMIVRHVEDEARRRGIEL